MALVRRKKGVRVDQWLLKNMAVNMNTGCWEWTRTQNGVGYGISNRAYVHRLMAEVVGGPIPKGKFVLHRCDNPICFRPGHLFIGTHADNMRDARVKGRVPRGTLRPNSKLNEVDIPRIRSMCKEGVSQSRVGKMFGVSQSAIWAIVQNKKWTHIQSEVL
jgi:hypothetical protein